MTLWTCRQDVKTPPVSSHGTTQSNSSAEGTSGGSPAFKSLKIGLTPYLGRERMEHEFSPFISYLAAQVGIPITLVVGSSYSDILDQMKAGSIQLAILSPLNYVTLKQESPKIHLLAKQIADGSDSYSGYIITTHKAGLKTIADLKGKRFAFVDRNSASGYIYPLALLIEGGLNPLSEFKSIRFSGSHERSIQLLLTGEVDAAAVYSGAMSVVKRMGNDVSDIRIIAQTDRIPYDAFCAGVNVPADVRDRVRKALLSLDTRTEQGREALPSTIRINGFIQANDSDYDSIRRIIKTLRSVPAELLPAPLPF